MKKPGSVRVVSTRPLFFVAFAVLVFKNDKKCKKMQKNEKKSQKNLHISKICCNFAPSFEKDMT